MIRTQGGRGGRVSDPQDQARRRPTTSRSCGRSATPPTARSGSMRTAAGPLRTRSACSRCSQEFGVTVLEQPLAPDDLDGLAQSAATRAIPLIADESCVTAADIPPLAGAGRRHQHQARQVRQPARSTADDRRRPGARHDGDGRLHDRVLAGRSPRPPTSRRWWTSWTSTAPRSSRRPLRRRQHRRRAGHASRSARARRRATMTGRFAQVALPLPLADPYTYRIPATLADRALPGARVVVPVRKREWSASSRPIDVAPPADGGARHPRRARRVEPALPPALLALGDTACAATTARRSGWCCGRCSRRRCGGIPAWCCASRDGGPRDVGGTAERLLDWLARTRRRCHGVGAPRGRFKRPLWDVVDRLQRVGAVELEVEPAGRRRGVPRRCGSRGLTGAPLSLARARRTLRPRAAGSGASTTRSRSAGGTCAGGRASSRQPARCRAAAIARSRAGSPSSSAPKRRAIRSPDLSTPAAPPPTLTAAQQAALASHRRAATRRVRRCSSASPGAGRPSCISRRSAGARGRPRRDHPGARDRAHAADRRAGSAAPSATRWPCCTAPSPTASAPTPGGRSAAGERRVAVGARSAVFAPVARARPHRRRRRARDELQERRDAALSRARRWPRCARGSRAPRLCWEAPRPRSRRWRGPASGTGWSGCRSGSARGRCRRWSWSICGSRRRSPGIGALAVVATPRRRGRRGAGPRGAGAAAAQPARLRRVPPVPRLRRRSWQCPRCSISLTRAPAARRTLRCHYCGHRGADADDLRECGGIRCTRCGASAPSSSSDSWPSGFRRPGSRGWTSTPPAPSGRTSASSVASSGARSTCCSARR